MEEPETMARVQGCIDDRWPKHRGAIAYIDGGLRIVAVRFPRIGRVAGHGATWNEAFVMIDKVRRALNRALAQ